MDFRFLFYLLEQIREPSRDLPRVCREIFSGLRTFREAAKVIWLVCGSPARLPKSSGSFAGPPRGCQSHLARLRASRKCVERFFHPCGLPASFTKMEGGCCALWRRGLSDGSENRHLIQQGACHRVSCPCVPVFLFLRDKRSQRPGIVSICSLGNGKTQSTVCTAAGRRCRPARTVVHRLVAKLHRSAGAVTPPTNTVK